MEPWTHQLKHGLDKVPRLGADASAAGGLLLQTQPSRWDWRQRATSRLLARAGDPSARTSLYPHRSTPWPPRLNEPTGSRHAAGRGPDPGAVQGQASAGSSTSGPSTLATSSVPSPWVDFGKTIPQQLRQLPRRITPSSTLLLGNAVPAASTTSSSPKRRARVAARQAARRTAKGKDRALEAQTDVDTELAVEDVELLRTLAQHQVERTEVLLPAIRAYAARLSALLDLERDARRREVDARHSRPIIKLIEQGITIDGLQAYWQSGDQSASSTSSTRKKKASTSTNNAVPSTKRMAIFKLPAGRLLEWNRLKVGDKVELSHGTGALFLDAGSSQGSSSGFGQQLMKESGASKLPHDSHPDGAGSLQQALHSGSTRPVGTIVEKTPFRLRVLFDLAKLVDGPATAMRGFTASSPSGGRPIDLVNDLENCTSWRLDLGENDTAEVRMRDALRALEHDIDFLERVSLRSSQQPAEMGTGNASTVPDTGGEMEEAWIRSMTTRDYAAAQQRCEYVLSGCKVLDALLNVPSPSLRQLQSSLAPRGRGRPRKQTQTTFDGDCRIRSWAHRHDRDDPLVMDGDPDLGDLNSSQRRAVAMMLRNRVSLVQGPPGTGKTRTIVETIRLLKHHFEVPQPILLTAHTNVAVDNLAEGCRQAGLRVVRAGNSPKAAGSTAASAASESNTSSTSASPTPTGSLPAPGDRPGLAECTLDHLMSKHPGKADLDALTSRLTTARLRLGEMYAALENAGKDISGMADAVPETVDEGDDGLLLPIMPSSPAASTTPTPGKRLPKDDEVAAVRKQVAKLSQRVFLQTQVILSHILHSADVVCTTALSASSTTLRSIDFPVVFFDEGSMATEPVALVPLMKGCEHLAIVGDHRQLPPVVSSSAARAGGLSLSLFERLMATRGTNSAQTDLSTTVHDDVDDRNGAIIPSTMLTVQHRMHPALSAFPNKTFYGGVLKDGSRTTALAPLRTGFSASMASQYVAFLNHSASEQKVDNSLQNEYEARLACDLVASILLRNLDLNGNDIGIVTPYIAQVQLLSRMLRADLGGDMRQRMDACLKNMSVDVRRATEDALSARHISLGERAKEALNVEVHSVDGFEGREKAAIVFSTVRTNGAGYVGFLADGRRLNVALTRAQRGLYLLGNLTTWERAEVSDVGDREMERADVDLLKAFAAHLRASDAVLSVKGSHTHL